MKHKPKLVNIGRSTYFHHRHGVVQQKKRFRVTILYASLLLVIGGVFFTSSQFALPAIKRLAELQKQHNVGVNTSVLAEPDTKPSLEIRKENDALKELLEEKLAEFPDNRTWGIYMYDLQDSTTVNINSDKVFPAGSLYKLYLLEALESKLPFDRWQYTWTDGINVEDCVQSMLQVSDDACAEQLADYIGWGV
ncbi:MAG TPA: hypothetical protein VFK11_05130, partial [Candidatus Saccharimonadales bacterium]|nr:hypothetical protein [Candidatus Saccharimonadales bacterium]